MISPAVAESPGRIERQTAHDDQILLHLAERSEDCRQIELHPVVRGVHSEMRTPLGT